jgi:hypothetical protein
MLSKKTNPNPEAIRINGTGFVQFLINAERICASQGIKIINCQKQSYEIKLNKFYFFV